ncbi:MAG: hypothetical protein ACREMP_08380 [Candidatus Tyrphobacter sp.]
MVPADVALALLINRTAAAYESDPPSYIVYRERTVVKAPSLGRSQEIDRSVAARNIDDLAVMRDLPGGGRRVGPAFPVIPYFDPFSQFTFSYFANLKRVDISLDRGAPIRFTLPPSNPNVDVVVPYMSFWDVSYAPGSRPSAPRFTIAITPRLGNAPQMYPSDVVEDPETHLPSRVVLRDTASDMVISLDYSVVDGHWTITHGTFTATEHALFLTFVVTADVTYDDISFPETAPPELAALPPPSPSPSPTP